jgi:hypothetical protein
MIFPEGTPLLFLARTPATRHSERHGGPIAA